MIDLDRPDSYAALDPAKMLARVMELDRQIADAWRLATQLRAPADYRQATSIVVLGMGGSAIGGDLVRTLVAPRLRVPLLVVREYDAPAFVGPETLAIASSYSGGTEETLSAVKQALAAGARVVAITTGGQLAELARQQRLPLLRFDYPAQPRAALGYSLMLILGTLVRLGYLESAAVDIEAAAAAVRAQRARLAPEVPTAENLAKQLALRLRDKLAILYGGGLMAEVARRWKGQFNENSKHWAFFEQLPELDHNAIMGYRFPRDLAGRVCVLLLGSARNHPRIQTRAAVTADILRQHGVETVALEAEGDSDLAHVLTMTQLGDFVTYYLALLNGIDPSTIDAIDSLKAALAERP